MPQVQDKLNLISKNMHDFNVQEEAAVKREWNKIISSLRDRKNAAARDRSVIWPGISALAGVQLNEVLSHDYGFKLSPIDCFGDL